MTTLSDLADRAEAHARELRLIADELEARNGPQSRSRDAGTQFSFQQACEARMALPAHAAPQDAPEQEVAAGFDDYIRLAHAQQRVGRALDRATTP